VAFDPAGDFKLQQHHAYDARTGAGLNSAMTRARSSGAGSADDFFSFVRVILARGEGRRR
jgi:hypothetical protein